MWFVWQSVSLIHLWHTYCPALQAYRQSRTALCRSLQSWGHSQWQSMTKHKRRENINTRKVNITSDSKSAVFNVCVASCLPRYFNLVGFWKYRCPFTAYNNPQSYACGLADNEINKKQLKEFYLEMSFLTAQFLQRNKLCRHQKSACLYLKLTWIHFRSLDMMLLCLGSLSETSFPFEELSYTNIIDFSFDSGIYMHKRVLVLKAM